MPRVCWKTALSRVPTKTEITPPTKGCPFKQTPRIHTHTWHAELPESNPPKHGAADQVRFCKFQSSGDWGAPAQGENKLQRRQRVCSRVDGKERVQSDSRGERLFMFTLLTLSSARCSIYFSTYPRCWAGARWAENKPVAPENSLLPAHLGAPACTRTAHARPWCGASLWLLRGWSGKELEIIEQSCRKDVGVCD